MPLTSDKKNPKHLAMIIKVCENLHKHMYVNKKLTERIIKKKQPTTIMYKKICAITCNKYTFVQSYNY